MDTIVAIIDDDKRICDIIQDYLLQRDVECTVHFSGEAFFEDYSKSETHPPDIVIIDMSLPPGMNGCQVLEHALRNQRFANSLFVSHTGYLEAKDEEWLGYIGFDANIHKPSSFPEFWNVLQKLLEERELIISRRDPYGNLLSVLRQLSEMRLRTRVLEDDFIKKLISPQVFMKLDSSPSSTNPANREIAVGFADIRGFTQLANRLQINQVNELLSIFFDEATEQVISEGGFIDKFIGDAVMWFHDQESMDTNCRQCIRAASKIIKNLSQINTAIQERLHLNVKIEVGVGVACGSAAVGLFGAHKRRIQYSVLGPPVNLASRLCSEARANELLIGGEAIEHCPYKTKKIGYKAIKGFDHEVELQLVIIPKGKIKNKLTKAISGQA